MGELGHSKVQHMMCRSNFIGLILAGAVEERKGKLYLAFISYTFFFFWNPHQGLLRTDPVPEAGEDAAATINATETLSEEEQEELRRELAKVGEHSFYSLKCFALKIYCCALAGLAQWIECGL